MIIAISEHDYKMHGLYEVTNSSILRKSNFRFFKELTEDEAHKLHASLLNEEVKQRKLLEKAEYERLKKIYE